ncbi:hypothetical protein [Rubrivirga marina]|uniref:Uncharacterized protein n=1 Tax=Rubrivirga marina TaxID=1196024 RepID=A0A271IX54_9BACT|nr:hypothetical protein [Rubrivirga marina]PAP75772.1 hypothetical protein BSZ37_04615 [Rubrivirga marina]
MTGLSLHTALPTAPTAPSTRTARPSLAAPAAPLTAAEEARIADAFPARPAVAQKLYGPSRQVQQAPQLGARLDLSA